MRAIVPKPARTRSERVFTWLGSGSENISGSSS